MMPIGVVPVCPVPVRDRLPPSDSATSQVAVQLNVVSSSTHSLNPARLSGLQRDKSLGLSYGDLISTSKEAVRWLDTEASAGKLAQFKHLEAQTGGQPAVAPAHQNTKDGGLNR
jgi:hypothetical protein